MYPLIMVNSKPRVPEILEPIRALGSALHNSWRRTGFATEAFSTLALQALEESQVSRQIGLDKILRWAFECECLPPQRDLRGKFGQPPITLFNNDRFSISALVWVDADTSIHQHGFSGAFSVLSGSSLHRTFRFEERSVVSHTMKHGRLVPLELELLKSGDCRQIGSGSDFIHTVYHLDRPTVSLVIRTHAEPSVGPQWDYLRSGVAMHPFAKVATVTRLRQIASSMARLKHPELVTILTNHIEHADPWTTLQLLQAIDSHEFGRKISSDVLRLVRVLHGELGDAIIESMYETRSTNNLSDLRNATEDPDRKYFIALALNVTGREELLRFMQLRFPDSDAVQKVTEILLHLLPLDEHAHRTGGPMAIPFAREVLLGRSPADLMSDATKGDSDIPVTEVARLSLLLPRLSLFRAIFDSPVAP